MKLEYKITPPIADMVKELDALKAGLGVQGQRAALVAGAAPLKTAMKGTVPVGDTAALKKAIGHVSISKRAKSRLGVPDASTAILVGSNRKIAVNGRKLWQGRKAHWMEEGTKHISPKGWMANALSAAGGQMEARFYDGLAKYLERQRAKHSA